MVFDPNFRPSRNEQVRWQAVDEEGILGDHSSEGIFHARNAVDVVAAGVAVDVAAVQNWRIAGAVYPRRRSPQSVGIRGSSHPLT